MSGPETYIQWVVLEITNSFKSRPIKIQNATLLWGQFHKEGDIHVEIPKEDIDKIVIPADSEQSVSSSARLQSQGGTEGTIDLYDDTTKICTLYWLCPWGHSSDNNFEVRDVNKAGGYIVSNGPWNPTGGVLGHIEIKVKE
ncbi:Asp-hemolysin [Hygrophoropsis aurantiaca]|uniref:Asp-hemolysin n=1 Tax=Hygrophoropsis aurantiaca TaxID=72124 RepID=A0ACB7ZXD6_9AGAM|nr:Asp-hemolysin [Hygrophoropsis aurantiaca]